ncbi:MAG: nitrate reductase molybdenum cofactor assembly chaperone [Gemmatimonadaceae bacterium]|nr:nitrate reductase molybdenum cofactor assembly chaperone [Gemmatimonadaceae bacterium]
MSDATAVRGDAYSVLSELWCSPQDTDAAELRRRASEVADELELRDREAAVALRTFLAGEIADEDYIALFELAPQCALYLGSHSFDEPMTCAQAGVSDRNGYMIELRGVYGHLGLAPDRSELPDYLPLMIEFLALTAESDDPVRRKLITEYMLPYLPPMRSRLVELQSHYVHLLDALERILRSETGSDTTEGNHV